MQDVNWFRSAILILPTLLLAIWAGPTAAFTGNVILPDPGEVGPCDYERLSLEIQGNQIAVFIPLEGSCDSWSSAPFPGLVFAHGFSMMGFSNGVADVAGHGEHLASWGYWVAIPALPDDAESRIEVLRLVIDHLLLASSQTNSPLYQKIDAQRLAVAGYSLGGATAMATSARDERVQTVVALDPVYHEGDFSGEGNPIWNPEVDGQAIKVPAGILGSPASSCNAQADYAEIYDFVGAGHKAAYQVTGASHCDFLDPGNSYCALFCGGTSDATRTALSQRYMTAWLNYYLLSKDEYFAVLFGDGLAQDIANNSISAEYANQPRGFQGFGTSKWVLLSWEVYDLPILDGYNIYRREPGGVYPSQPYRQVDLTGSHTDEAVSTGEQYGYKICSYDLGGNQHQCSAEIMITVGESEAVFLPVIWW